MMTSKGLEREKKANEVKQKHIINVCGCVCVGIRDTKAKTHDNNNYNNYKCNNNTIINNNNSSNNI